MTAVLVDANVLLDLFTDDPHWADWSERQLNSLLESNTLCINPIIYAEVSVGFERIEELDASLAVLPLHMLPLCRRSDFIAGKAFLRYRRTGGPRRSPLPDFYTGGQAAARGLTLLTRDGARYRTYFPEVELITPPG